MISKRDIPNILTLMRLVLIPVFVLAIYLNHWFISGCLFGVASITDFLDGYLARKWDARSRIGQFWDPIADKLIVIPAIIMLVHTRRVDDVNIIPAMIIVMREIFVSGLREFLSSLRAALPVIKLGKVKTFFQMLSLYILIVFGHGIVWSLGIAMLWIAAALTVWSGYIYLRVGLRHM